MPLVEIDEAMRKTTAVPRSKDQVLTNSREMGASTQ